MAIIKSKENNQGVTYEYWVAQQIANIIDKKTDVLLCGFVDKAARTDGHRFIEKVKVGTMDGLYPTGNEVYAFCKASNMVANPLYEEGGEEPEQIENNWFADSVDDI